MVDRTSRRSFNFEFPSLPARLPDEDVPGEGDGVLRLVLGVQTDNGLDVLLQPLLRLGHVAEEGCRGATLKENMVKFWFLQQIYTPKKYKDQNDHNAKIY